MNRLKRTRSAALALAGAAAAILSSGCRGVERGDEARIRITDEPVSDDLLTAAPVVRVTAAVDGDVAAGEEVTIAGPVEGYVMGAGRRVRVAGRIANDLWAAGETVDVAGPVAQNARVAGRAVHLHPDADIGRNARLAGNTVTAEGHVERNLSIAAAEARIGGDVGGDVLANAGRVTVLPGTVIRGDLVVRSPQPPQIAPDSQVLGQVRHQPTRSSGWRAWPMSWGVTFLALLVLGLATIAMAPVWPARVTRTLLDRIGMSALTGVLVLLVLPAVAALLVLTVIGIPLGLVLLSAFVMIVLLSLVPVASWVGGWTLARMSRPQAAPWLRMTVGALLVSFAITLPAVGWLLAIASVVFGAGAVALERSTARAAAPA